MTAGGREPKHALSKERDTRGVSCCRVRLLRRSGRRLLGPNTDRLLQTPPTQRTVPQEPVAKLHGDAFLVLLAPDARLDGIPLADKCFHHSFLFFAGIACSAAHRDQVIGVREARKGVVAQKSDPSTGAAGWFVNRTLSCAAASGDELSGQPIAVCFQRSILGRV